MMGSWHEDGYQEAQVGTRPPFKELAIIIFGIIIIIILVMII